MANNPVNVLAGSKTGDFIHCMYAPFHLWKTQGIKSNIFISEVGDVFEHGLHKTFEELTPIILKQEYVESFQIWSGQHIDYYMPLFRDQKYLYTKCWKEMICSIHFQNEKPIDGGWITFDKSEKFDNTLVINRVNKSEFSPMIKNSYELEIKKFSKTIFAGSADQFNNFKLNSLCEHRSPENLSDWFSIISKSSFFLGNQSAPAAIASALDVPRLVELLPFPDAIHYFDESIYSKNVSFINPFKLCNGS